jgi:hypothetical protein
VLDVELPWLKNVKHARKLKKLPMVFSKEEMIAADPRLTDAVLTRYEQEVLTQGHYAAEMKFKS